MEKKGIEVVRTTSWSAGPGCHGGCGVLAYVKDGKLEKIEGDPEHPWNQGRLCARVLAMKQYVEHPKRLKKPLIRRGKRGEGKWEEVTWDFAYDFIEKDRNYWFRRWLCSCAFIHLSFKCSCQISNWYFNGNFYLDCPSGSYIQNISGRC